MLFYEGKRILEGIDSINLRIQPFLCPYFENMEYIDPYNKISVFKSRSIIPSPDFIFSYKYHYYLHISGEYINPDTSIIDTIIKALHTLLNKGALRLVDYRTEMTYYDYSLDFIRDNLRHLVKWISGIEFCFDFKEQHVRIKDDAKIIDTNDPAFPQLIEKKLKDRPPCLIRENTTYYSNDYSGNRKSTLKLYDRAIWLRKKNNELPKSIIENNPYNKRIEFVLEKVKNSCLAINNLDGNYNQVISRFTPYLAKLYKKYFLDDVSVDVRDHPYFTMIYHFAHSDYIKTYKSLETVVIDKKLNSKDNDFQKEYRLVDYLKKEARREAKTIKEIPVEYFVSALDSIAQNNSYSPFDYMDKDNILLEAKDEGETYAFFKNKSFSPTFKTVEDENA